MVITKTEQLQVVCQRFAEFPFITIDTEFIREHTFFARLCLIQIASMDEVFCVDPLVADIDLTPLYNLLKNDRVVKVFHSARQDIEIFYQLMRVIPYPLFDTQIGSMVCGFGENVSYQQLVQSLLGVPLDKSMRVTNWEQRPLSEPQIQYALRDVTYLRDVYLILKEQIEKSGRWNWLDEEMAVLYDKQTYDPSDERLCERINCSLHGSVAQRVYKDLYIWREHKARELNRPRRQIIKDDLLYELALFHPKTTEELQTLRGVPSSLLKREKAEELLEIIQTSLSNEGEPQKLVSSKRTINATRKNLLEMLYLVLKIVSAQEKVASKLIAEQKDLLDFIEGKKDVKFLSGWRYDIFGHQAELLVAGELCIYYHPQTCEIYLNRIFPSPLIGKN